MHINLRLQVSRVGVIAIFALALIAKVSAQSSDIESPTPVTSDEITAKIAPRDIGDARRTTHFYVFNGKQGDIAVNVESKNLDGDIDLYIADGLRPMTKIVLYGSGDDVSRSAKSIYLRREDVLILRVQARSVGDADGTYQVKFSGAFAPADAALVAKYAKNTPPAVAVAALNSNSTAERVTSTGARIPKPPVNISSPRANTTPAVARTNDERTTKREQPNAATSNVKSNSPANAETMRRTNDTNSSAASGSNATEMNVESNTAAKTNTVPPPVSSISTAPATPKKSGAKTTSGKTKAATTNSAKTNTGASNSSGAKSATSETAIVSPAPPKGSTPDATSNTASNIASSPTSSVTNAPTKTEPTTSVKSLDSRTARLVVELKDGTRIERDMTNVQLMLVEDGRLVVITKDGQTMRQPLANIARMAIEP